MSMETGVLADLEQKEADTLAQEFKNLAEQNFLNPPNEKVHERLDTIRSNLKQMGIHISYQMALDIETCRLTVTITLVPLWADNIKGSA